MTDRRYEHYRRAIGVIEGLDPRRVGDASRLLRELAQDLLLSRTATADSDQLAEQVRLALDGLLSRHELSGRQARQLWTELYACGPGAAALLPQPAAVGATS